MDSTLLTQTQPQTQAPQSEEAEGGALTARQLAFVREYLVDANGRQAAIRAGYAAGSADVQASRLLATPHVRAAVDAGQAEKAKACEVTAAQVMRELALMALADTTQAFHPDGTMRRLDEMPPEVRRSIAGIEVTEKGTKVRFHPKTRALELLGKSMRLFVDRVEHEAGQTLAELVAASMTKQ